MPSRLATIATSGSLAIATYLERPAAALHKNQSQAQTKPAEPPKETSRDGEATADRKLLADLEGAFHAHADHLDFTRLDRELAAAFRRYVLDLDLTDPKAAGFRLTGKPATPAFAAAIDEWCRIRHRKLNARNWRRLSEVARAADPDPWRDSARPARPAASKRAQ